MKLTVKSPIRHNGKTFHEGQTIELDAKTAEPLLAEGVAVEAAKPAPKSKGKGEDEGDGEGGGGE